MPLSIDGDEAPPKAATRMRQASLPSGVDGASDRISKLPDTILGSILFLLPLKDAGRTTTLAKSWKDVFQCSPISLDDEHVARRRVGRPRSKADHDERVQVISRILAKHKGPVPRVRLAKTRFFDFDGRDGHGIKFDAFDGRRVEELIVHSTYPIQFFPAPPLRSVQVNSCIWFLPEAPLPASLAGIKELSLRAVKISAAGVHALLEHCIKLESLLLSSYHKDEKGMLIDKEVHAEGMGWTLQVRSQSLRSLSLEIFELGELVIVDAPNLERLLGEVASDKGDCEVTLINAPKLQIVGFLTMDRSWPSKMLGMALEPSSPIHSVKTLGVCLDLCSRAHVKRMLHLLRQLPCLETLYIKIFTNTKITETVYSESDPYVSGFLEIAVGNIYCLRNSVKTIVMGDLWLHTDTWALHFAKKLLQWSKKLEVMKIFHVPVDKKKQARLMRKKLGLNDRDPNSIKARVVFPRDYISYRQVNDVFMDASSLALPDPMFYQRTFQSVKPIREQWKSYLNRKP